MKLRYSNTSPYVRKVLIVAHETGLVSRLELVPTDPWAPDTDLPKDNPLGKVPTLVVDGGDHLYDSPVICEYLDSLHEGRKFFPPMGPARWRALRRQALGDGLIDATVALRIETTMRPSELRWAAWVERQKATIHRVFDHLEADAASFSDNFTIGEVSVVCACGYVDLRYAKSDWRATHPRLADWYAAQQARPSVQATMPRD